MDLISREKLKEVIEPMVGKFDDDGEFWWTRESILRAIDNAPTIEELVTVEYKQNECLYLETDEDTLLETEYIVMSTDGMYKEYVHETE